jgi:hypothetical protein
MYRQIAIVTVAVLMFANQLALADSVKLPYSYVKPTPDGKHLFVMISPRSPEDDASAWIESTGQEIRRIRNAFKQSGLYLNDGSATPIWTVNWYAYDVAPLSDGVHLVRPGPWASSSDSEAVAFFANGKLVRSYTVGDLVAVPALMPHSVSHFTWRSEEHLNDQYKTYTIKTKHGERYTIDVTTGQILSTFSPVRWGLTVVIIFVAGTLGIWCWRRRQHA